MFHLLTIKSNMHFVEHWHAANREKKYLKKQMLFIILAKTIHGAIHLVRTHRPKGRKKRYDYANALLQ